MSDLHQCAEAAGIQLSYNDVWGKEHLVPDISLENLLVALGEQEENGILPSVKVISENRPTILMVPGAKSWKLDGKVNEAVDGKVNLPALPRGYYELSVQLADTELNTFLIVAPEQCWLPKEMQPEAMHKRKRVWGLAAQLYSIRSKRNWGIGDFGDLAMLVKSAAASGADVVGLNPLHAMFPNNPHAFSPYAPSNRCFLNVIYIDVEAVDGFEKSEELSKKITALCNAELVDYVGVAGLKREALEELFNKRVDNSKFEKFITELGEPLLAQAVFDALSEHFVKQGIFDWHKWPEPFQIPDSVEVKKFAKANQERIEFYTWLQFIADSQLAQAQNIALQNNMSIGLYRDLAVGSEGAGAEIWLEAKRFISGFAVGAPPDEYNPKGQNWGLPALNPITLRQLKFKPFIELLRANMRHARALRIDHAFGLARLFLIPDGRPANEGAYLTYPFEEMLAILRLESHLNQCIVIGEDLGTFPPNYKELAAKSGVLSYKVVYFEKDDTGFTPAAKYPPLSLATLSTHDLPTLEGWKSGIDIAERTELELYPSEDLLNKDRANRDQDKPLLAKALGGQLTFEAAESFLAKSPAAIVMVQLEDLLGVKNQANMPATTTERPNWRMKMPKLFGEIKLKPLGEIMNRERNRMLLIPPRATYRLQFHKDFTFYDAVKIIPYLADLGVSHVYASPYLKARPGSTHGYDITDHNSFNPELGGAEGYEAFVAALKENGLKQILDFVPNHMGVGQDNEWWQDLLEKGRGSFYAKYFDIDWKPRNGSEAGKVILPVLGDYYGKVLAKGELELISEDGKYYVKYFENKFPIRPEDKNLDVPKLNSDKEALHQLLEQQHYRLVFWRVALSEINYRRFFDINDLAGLRVEEPELFEKMHKLVFSLIDKGELDGLRIDHVDGLADPAGYCRQIKEKMGVGLYLVVEKILASHEALRHNWQIEGTSGYYALNFISSVFVDGKNQQPMDRVYRRITGMNDNFADMVYGAKSKILETALSSELLSLSLLLKSIANQNPYTRDFTHDILRQAIKEIIGYFPVYRSYVTQDEIDQDDIKVINWAVGKAKKASQLPDGGVYDFIAGILMLQGEQDYEKLIFIRKFQQLSGPVMAKGLEDTTFYRYNRLLSLNEVGGDPSRFGISVTAFHHINVTRAENFPHSMIATATHDTKRGEDSRARISILSEVPKAWGRAVTHWMKLNRSRRTEIDGKIIPSPNEEYFIYQTLIGSWPNEMLDAPDVKGLDNYLKRLKEYLTKALREAKLNSSWTMPDENYETAVHNFVSGVLDISKANLFLDNFLLFMKRISELGAIASLGQLALKLTIPGVPDIYQGTEYWDYSFVDPDNRRPVDYKVRMQTLESELSFDNWQNGQVKQQLLKRLLAHRKNNSEIYSLGSYKPLTVTGKHKSHIIAFMREYKKRRVIVIIPVLLNRLANDTSKVTEDAWANTEVKLPPGNYKNILNNNSLNGGRLSVAKLLAEFPVAVIGSDYSVAVIGSDY